MNTIDIIYQAYTNGGWLPNVTNLDDYAGIYGHPIQGVYANINIGTIQYRAHTQNGSWLPWVSNRSDYAGILGKNIDGLQMKISGVSGYDVRYRVYVGGRWLPWIVGSSDYLETYGQPIEGIQVKIVCSDSIEFNKKNQIVSAGVSARKVFIDPGHGGNDPGAIGNGLNEKNIVLSISKKIGDILISNGISIRYSRTSDQYISLENRAEQANNWGASLFVSIHTNSFSGSARGTECYTYLNSHERDIELSKRVVDSISKSVDIPNRGNKTADFAVLRLTNMSSILVETAFISDINDANLLKNKQDNFAYSIADSILRYFNS